MKELRFICKGLIDYSTAPPRVKTLSPAMWNGLFRHKGTDARYIVWDSSPEDVPSRLDEIRRNPEIIGGNVSTPDKEVFYREAVSRSFCRLSPAVEAIGAVNTYRRDDDGITVFTTDHDGIKGAIDEAGGGMDWIDGREVGILGAGGTSLSAMYACMKHNAGAIHIWNRTPEKARAVADRMIHAFPGFLPNDYTYKDFVFPGGMDGIDSAPLEELRLLINVTKLGMAGGLERQSPFTEKQIPA